MALRWIRMYGGWIALFMLVSRSGAQAPASSAPPASMPLPIPRLVQDVRRLDALRGLGLTEEQIGKLISRLIDLQAELGKQEAERRATLGPLYPSLLPVRTAWLQGVPPDPRVVQPVQQALAQWERKRSAGERQVGQQLGRVRDVLTDQQKALIEPAEAYAVRLREEKAAQAVRTRVLQGLMDTLQRARTLADGEYSSQKVSIIQAALQRALQQQATQQVLEVWTPLLTSLFDEFRGLSDVQFSAQREMIQARLQQTLWPPVRARRYVLSEPEFASFWSDERTLVLLREMQQPPVQPTPVPSLATPPADPANLAQDVLTDFDLIPIMDAMQFSVAQLRALPPILRQLQEDLKRVDERINELWRMVQAPLLAKRKALVDGIPVLTETEQMIQATQDQVDIEEGRKSQMVEEVVQQTTTRILTPEQALLLGPQALDPTARRALMQEMMRARQRDYAEMTRLLERIYELKRLPEFDYRRAVVVTARQVMAGYFPNVSPDTPQYDQLMGVVLRGFGEAHRLSRQDLEVYGPAFAYQFMLSLRELAGIPSGPQLPQQLMTVDQFQEFLTHPRLPQLMEERLRYQAGVSQWMPAGSGSGGASPR